LNGLFAAWLARPWMLRRERARWIRAHEALANMDVGFVAHQRATGLSYGDRRSVEVARAIAGRPVAVLLDEPSAGLNAEETADLARRLRALRDTGVTVVLVDHKIDFISSICSEVGVLELGQLIARGDPASVLNDARVVEVYLGTGRH